MHGRSRAKTLFALARRSRIVAARSKLEATMLLRQVKEDHLEGTKLEFSLGLLTCT